MHADCAQHKQTSVKPEERILGKCFETEAQDEQYNLFEIKLNANTKLLNLIR